MKITLEQVLKASMTIREIGKQKCSPKFSYGVFKNQGKMKPDMDGIMAAQATMNALEQKRLEYCKKYGEKDKNGKPILLDLENGMKKYILNEDASEFLAILEEIKKAEKEHEKFLKTEVDIDLHMIDFEELPEKISPDDYRNLSIMIHEPKEDKK